MGLVKTNWLNGEAQKEAAEITPVTKIEQISDSNNENSEPEPVEKRSPTSKEEKALNIDDLIDHLLPTGKLIGGQSKLTDEIARASSKSLTRKTWCRLHRKQERVLHVYIYRHLSATELRDN